MSSIHYFQRYSQPENVATNNTLLLLSRLYQYSSSKFNGFLTELLGDNDLDANVQFNQQRLGKGSIPDGSISQVSFNVIVETKLHKQFSLPQLIGHLRSFDAEQHQVLLSLSPKCPDNALQNQIAEEVHKFNALNGKSVKYIPTTFAEIISKFKASLEDHDFQLLEIVDDFESYCIQDKLIVDDDARMRVVTCGWSLTENFQYNLYYAFASRGYSDHAYIGLYANKCVKGVGKLENTICADFINDELTIKESTVPVTEVQRENIIGVIKAAKINNNWDLSLDHKFFCVDKFHSTCFKKNTKYPLQGTKLFDLRKVLNHQVLPSTEEIAELLKGKNWEDTSL